ncbi:ParB/RepB/Spo0J family partition protein [Undibacterium curvum]|uniref:ParB/RepB/Spo0J family partition protein n=1 Tax=Undibacterium curvum TaxID=2762294 RepID=UPI003D0BA740
MVAKKKTATVIVANEQATDSGVFGIYEISKIRISKTNRKHFDETKLNELAATVKAMGVLEPILIRPVTPTAEEPEEYEIVAGERRYRASIIAGLTTIPAMCRNMSDEQAAEVQIIENLQREDPHPLEEAPGYQNLMFKHGWTVEMLIEKLNRSKSYIYGRLKLCSLAAPLHDDFYAKKFDASIALLVARIPLPGLQIKAMNEIMSSPHDGQPMSFRDGKKHIENRYMLQLSNAPFDIKDAKLMAIAGSCVKCPKRTGNQPEIYPDIDQSICTDPDCFEEKKAALDLRKIAEANKKGIQVFEGDEAAEKSRLHNDHIDADNYLWSFRRFKKEEDRNQRVKSAIPPDAMPQPDCLLRLPNGKLITWYLRKDIQSTLEKLGICMTEQENDERYAAIVNTPPTEKQLAERAQQAADKKVIEDENKFRLALYKQIRQRGLIGLDIKSQREVLNLALIIILENSTTDCDDLSDLYKFGVDRHSAIANHIEQASSDELQRVLMDFLITDHLGVADIDDIGEEYDHFSFMLKIAKNEGIDIDAVRKTATQPPEIVDATPVKRPILSLKKKTEAA